MSLGLRHLLYKALRWPRSALWLVTPVIKYSVMWLTPLKTLVSDLRQTPAKTSKPCGDEVAKLLQRQLTSMLSRIQANEAAVADLRTITTTRENICYAMNLHNMVIHGMRAGDGSTTRCGWKVSTAKIKRGDVKFIDTIAAEH